MSQLDEFTTKLHRFGSPEKARNATRFFKTGVGDYGEGDIFIGASLPEIRKLIKSYTELPLSDIEILITNRIHEERLAALIMLVNQFRSGNEKTQAAIYDFYITHTKWINNWDLVDVSAEFIVGAWLENKDSKVLEELAHSPLIWERRIAVISTFYYIKKGNPNKALEIITILLYDKQDLIQKANGWMLREIGKRCSVEVERSFLDTHYKTMPRTTLRYAIERFPSAIRTHYLSK